MTAATPTLSEDLTRYAKSSLAHQLARIVATTPACAHDAAHLHYVRAGEHGDGPFRARTSIAKIVFHEGSALWLYDNDTAPNFGITVVSYSKGGFAQDMRSYMRNDLRELDDATWRTHIATVIADDFMPALSMRTHYGDPRTR